MEKEIEAPYKEEIEGEIWYKLQAHQVFDLLPVNPGGQLYFNTNILIDERDIDPTK